MKCLNNIYPFIINNRILYLSFPEKSNIEYQFFPIRIREKEISVRKRVGEKFLATSIDRGCARKTLFNSHLQRLAIPSPLSPAMIFPQEVWFSETLPRTVK